MKLSTRGRYAIRIMLDICANGKENPVSLAAVAERQEISLKYTERIAASLVKGGLLTGVRGVQGGYRLTKPPQRCSVYEVLSCAEGELAPTACAKERAVCARGESCSANKVWRGLYEVTKNYLESVTLQDLF